MAILTSLIAAGAASTWIKVHGDMSAAIDARIAGRTADNASKLIYSAMSHVAASYTRSATCWATGLKCLTAISPWNSVGVNLRAGIAISRDIVLCANHFPLTNGSTIRFVTLANATHVHTIAATDPVDGAGSTAGTYGDLQLCRLSTPLSADIQPAKVLDPWAFERLAPLAATAKLPLLMVDQEEKALVTEWAGAPGVNFVGTAPASGQRLAFYEAAITNDSGSPYCLMIGDQLVVLSVATGAGSGFGSAITPRLSLLQAAATALGSSYPIEAFTPYLG